MLAVILSPALKCSQSPRAQIVPYYTYRASMATEIDIREWQRGDLAKIQRDWLEFCRQATRSDIRLKPDCEIAMANWLAYRFKESEAFGFIAELDRNAVGFLIGRVGVAPWMVHAYRML